MVEDTILELERVLAEERDAIRRVDGARVLECAARKQALAATLNEAKKHFSPETMERLRVVAKMLRHNGILLAHARNILRDALAAAWANKPSTPGAPIANIRPGLTLSVRG